ncbi:MAG: NeuD/PglB/VioB family sugar acetyltransferase [Gammaproteobacteria bacterium]|nr:NeuD/PglB/VioB family sugar acetyltransferase [Gammaproteobacteria bacterium]
MITEEANRVNKEKIVLVGCGQHARVVMYNIASQGKYDVACFIDSDPSRVGETYLGHRIEGTYEDIDWIGEKYKTKKFFIAFGNMKYRKNTFVLFINKGWEPVNIIHPNAVISPDAKIGKGVLIECGCLITPNPIIGDNVVVNTGSQVNHDNIVEDNVYIASGVVLSGGVTIKENTLLDDGVIVTLGITVPPNSIFGAGTIVTKNYQDEGVYYGVPARKIR